MNTNEIDEVSDSRLQDSPEEIAEQRFFSEMNQLKGLLERTASDLDRREMNDVLRINAIDVLKNHCEKIGFVFGLPTQNVNVVNFESIGRFVLLGRDPQGNRKYCICEIPQENQN